MAKTIRIRPTNGINSRRNVELLTSFRCLGYTSSPPLLVVQNKTKKEILVYLVRHRGVNFDQQISFGTIK